MPSRWAPRLLALALALGGGCGAQPCARHSDCSPAQVCSTDGLCAVRPDAATADARDGTGAGDAADTADAAGADAAGADAAGARDAAGPDAVGPDAAVPDAAATLGAAASAGTAPTEKIE